MKDQFLIIAMPFRRHALEFESWNLFGFWILEFVWDLDHGFWNFTSSCTRKLPHPNPSPEGEGPGWGAYH